MEGLGHTFLDRDNSSKFSEVPGRCVPRSVQYSAGPSAPMPLVSHILDRVRALAGATLQWFECLCVTVMQDDGMTWTAESVRVGLMEKYPGFRCWTLAGRGSGGLPQVAELVGEGAFLKLASRFKFTSPFFSLRSWLGLPVVFLAVAIAVATKFGDELAKAQPGPFGTRWRDLVYVGLLAGSALLALVSKYFLERVLGRTLEKSREEFLKQLDANEKKLQYLDFVEAVAGLLGRLDYPRFVVVDGFERLDYTTRKVVERYCKELCKDGKGGELWVVFEGENGEKLSLTQSSLPVGYGGSRTRSYRQALLTPEEKIKLVAVANLPERAVEFATAKLICGEAKEGEKRFLDLFTEWRRRNPANPAQYGALDFLHLCALTSTPGIFYLQHRELRHDLAVKSGVRSAALTSFLPGTSLAQQEIGDQLIALDAQFRSALVYKKEGDPTGFRVVAAAAQVLADDAGDLGLLQPAGLGHVFWSLYWYAKVRRQPVEAFWLRKLGEHLLKAGSYRMPKEYQAETARILFEASLYTLEGSSRTNLFGQMLPLLERGVALLQSGPAIDAAQRKALTDFAWQSYLLVGGKAAREVLLELGSAESIPGADDAPDVLERYFLDAITGDEAQQQVLRAAVNESGDAIRDFGRIRSAWLNLTMLRFLATSIVQESLLESVAAAPALFDRARQRLAATGQPAGAPGRALDLMTLSMAAWAFGPSLACAKVPLGRNRFVQQLEMTRATLDLASEELRPNQARTETEGPGLDYLGDALRREACFFALAGLTAVGHDFDPSEGELTAEEAELMTGAFRKANEVFGISLPLPASVEKLKDPALVSELTEMLNVCGFVWQSFDLEWMRHAANLRKLQFIVICRGGAADAATPLASWADSLGAVLEQKGLAGALANCVMAVILSGTQELAAHYIRQAAQIAMARPFGPGLRCMLAMAAIDTSHHLEVDLTPFLRELAEPGVGGESAIERLFDEADPAQVRECAQRYLNAASSSPDEAFGDAIVQVVAAACDRLPPGPEKDDVAALLELKALEKKAAMGESIDPLATLAAWGGRKGLREYCRLLLVMVRDGYYNAEIRAESLRVLQRDPAQDAYNGYILLASAVLRREGERGEWQIPWRYLKAAIPTWEGTLVSETTIRIYQQLRARDRRNHTYEKKVIFWQERKLERDHLKRLPALAREGKFFLIFLEYFVSMSEWGLRTDPPPDVFWNRYYTTPDERANQVDAWRQSGGVVPAAILKREHGAILNGEFLCLGHFLFSPPLELDRKFNADRQSFDLAAHEGFASLVAMIINLPEFPSSIRNQLVRHSERLTRFSAPPELTAASGE